ncbi:MAG: hypothetical protein KatS3mg115_2399 [Candidatus Poribacteria bacterium]|nr:MAG: hypothetical protein KatS3mg115_2399 [Candidatus Poribacteria bacterium]
MSRFQRWERNPSAELVQELQEEPFPAELEGAILPVRFGETGEQIRVPDPEAAARYRADVRVKPQHVGGPARTAGNQLSPGEDRTTPGAPWPASRSVPVPRRPTLPPGPVEALLEWLHAEGVPATDSFHAGTFLCNEALFSALGRAEND